MEVAAILFDLDGTLVETTHLYEQAYMETLAGVGLPVSRERWRGLYSTGLSLVEWLKELDADPTLEPRIRAERDARYVALLREHVEWRPGAIEALRACAESHSCGIVTGSWLSYVDAIDARLHLRAHVHAIVTADDAPSAGKPKPDTLFIGAERLGVSPQSCVYVGDQRFDLEAAAAAGMRSVLVPGPHTPNGLESLATEVITDLSSFAARFTHPRARG